MPIYFDQDVRSASPGAHTVTGARGLILRVHTAADGSLTRSWFVRVNIRGRRVPRGLGAYPLVKLAKARERAAEAHRSVADGIDPGHTAKRRQRAAEEAKRLTFGKAVDDYLAKAASPYRNVKSDQTRERILRIYFAPLHNKEVTGITTEDVADILKSLRQGTASRAYTAFNEVFDYAEVVSRPLGVTVHNPATARSLAALGWKRKSSKATIPHPAVDWRIMSEVVAESRKLDGVAAACMTFAIATTVRCGTARLAKWRSIDLEKRLWTIPLADLKDAEHRDHKIPFVVPLNALAIDALEAMRGRSSSHYVFCNSLGAPLGDHDLTHLMRRLRRRHNNWRDPHTGRPFTVHGFRASFKTWTLEGKLDQKLFGHIPAREVAELVLGHRIGTDVERAYDRSDLLEARRAMLDLWSSHCLGARILQFPARA